ncbi:MAG: YhbY family RNA-binding protein [Gemmatimonadota bacterium]
MPLNSKQRTHLRSLAHHLKPSQHVGKEGLSEAALGAVGDAFNQRELIKVKIHEASPQPARDAGPIFVERLPGVEHVQTIGRTVVLYRRHPEKPEIELPR